MKQKQETAGSVEFRRITEGKSDNQVARELGVDQASVNRWRSGARIPDVDKRDLLEEKLGISRLLWKDLLGSGAQTTADDGEPTQPDHRPPSDPEAA